MLILVVNAGSSSLKYQLLDMETENFIAKGNCDRIGIDGHISYKTNDGRSLEEDCAFPTHTEAFEKVVEVLTTGETAVIKNISDISAVGHRVVQGGELYAQATLITDKVIKDIDSLKDLAPVHNPAHILAMNASKAVFPENTPQVAVFDTSFHQTIPKKAFMYGFPYEDYEKYHVRKYGFHGTSHRFVSKALADAMGKNPEDLKIVSCHLGNGSSITAVKGGKSVDTTMGLTPLDGVIMGTRCGNVDPSTVTFLQKAHNFTPDEMDNYMNKKSGLVGISGVSSDMRDISDAVENGNEKAKLARDILVYDIKKDIGALACAMGGLDAVLFTGGIGENDSSVRRDVCEGLEFLGIKLKEDQSSVHGKLAKISTDDASVEVWVVPTNEELLIARDTLDVISK
jgi:acetate kinase